MAAEPPKFVLGCFIISDQPWSIPPAYVSAARELGFDLIPIDKSQLLEDQGPVDCAIHKYIGDQWRMEVLDLASNVAGGRRPFVFLHSVYPEMDLTYGFPSEFEHPMVMFYQSSIIIHVESIFDAVSFASGEGIIYKLRTIGDSLKCHRVKYLLPEGVVREAPEDPSPNMLRAFDEISSKALSMFGDGSWRFTHDTFGQ
ncbi:inositol-tetrakisphosphate 1-kinase 1-like [Curcuma longa]|uniref:inositol-tetrakisphosphate 1-kinase 1-like n=1 Tax=Curcuma longa TaxID=136217 RepID=UPI003D9EBAE5